MDEQLKLLTEKIELLSQKVDKYGHEINLLKAEIARLKGENVTIPSQQVIYKTRQAKSSGYNFENFIGLELIHFVGIVVLLIGLAISVKFAIDANLISPLLRIILAYTASIILFILSFRLQKRFFLFGLILFSGAMASAYFTTYSAYEYYSFFPRMVAFCLMLLLTVFTVFNALKFDRQEIAILGLAGAYAIPFLVSTNNGNITALFSYILLINGGILVVSFKKYWPPLTYISFFVTWIIFIVTFFIRFESSNFQVFNIFSFLFFLLFLFNSLVFKLLKKEIINSSDSFIVIANSLFLYFAIATIYYSKYHTDLSTITVLFAIVYAGAALLSKLFSSLKILSNALFVLSITAFTCFVMMQYDGFTVTIIWVVMAIAIFMSGMIWKIKMLRVIAIGLFALTLIKLLIIDSDDFSDLQKIIAWVFTGAVLLAVSFLYQKFKQRIFTDGE